MEKKEEPKPIGKTFQIYVNVFKKNRDTLFFFLTSFKNYLLILPKSSYYMFYLKWGKGMSNHQK